MNIAPIISALGRKVVADFDAMLTPEERRAALVASWDAAVTPAEEQYALVASSAAPSDRRTAPNWYEHPTVLRRQAAEKVRRAEALTAAAPLDPAREFAARLSPRAKVTLARWRDEAFRVDPTTRLARARDLLANGGAR